MEKDTKSTVLCPDKIRSLHSATKYIPKLWNIELPKIGVVYPPPSSSDSREIMMEKTEGEAFEHSVPTTSSVKKDKFVGFKRNVELLSSYFTGMF
jgi:hypothetical protein